MSHDVLFAQFDMLKKQIPFLYSCLLVNMCAVSALFYASAPFLLYAVAPAIFTIVIVRRIVGWRRQRPSRELPVSTVRRELGNTIVLAWVLSMTLTVWVVALLQYAGGSEIILLAFFTWTTAVSTASNLAYLPRAHIGIMGVSAIPFAACILAYGELKLGISLILFATFSFIFMRLLLEHFVAFTEVVSSRASLVQKHQQAEAAHREVQRISVTDTLTGLPNRRAFLSDLEDLTKTPPNAADLWAVGVVDLNGFKPINDVFGHRSGDAVLIAVGERLTETIGTRGSVYRLGGDEYGVVVRDVSEASDLRQLGTELNDVLCQPYEFEFSTAMLSGSCGFAICPPAGETPDVLLENADKALYRAKKSRSREAAIYSPLDCDGVRESAAIEQALRRAIAANAIDLAYQPIIDLTEDRVVAFEALARWDDPELGRIGPDRFIEIAEQTGLIVDLTGQLLIKALDAAKQWPDDIGLSFNLSPILLVRTGYNLSIMSMLNEYGFSPRRLQLEITETALMSSFELARNNIRDLRMAGVGIALDDFGTGYASFGYLDEITIDKLKIDRSFVPGTDMPAGKRQILKAIIGLSTGMGIPTVLEGIEREDQLNEAMKAGCLLGQGYLFARPMPPERVGDYLAGLRGSETGDVIRAPAAG